MTRRRDVKREARERMRTTGESYPVALAAVLGPNARDAPPRRADAVPLLPARDIDEIETLFVRVGFESSRHVADTYLVVRRREIELHYTHTADLDPFTSAAIAVVRAHDVEELYAAFEASGALRVIPRLVSSREATAELLRQWEAGESVSRLVHLEDKPGGIREFAILDASNNLVRFGQRV